MRYRPELDPNVANENARHLLGSVKKEESPLQDQVNAIQMEKLADRRQSIENGLKGALHELEQAPVHFRRPNHMQKRKFLQTLLDMALNDPDEQTLNEISILHKKYYDSGENEVPTIILKSNSARGAS
jgi:hypothetical protein